MPPWDPKNPKDLLLMPAELLKDASNLRWLASNISHISDNNYEGEAKELAHTQIASALHY